MTMSYLQAGNQMSMSNVTAVDGMLPLDLPLDLDHHSNFDAETYAGYAPRAEQRYTPKC